MNIVSEVLKGFYVIKYLCKNSFSKQELVRVPEPNTITTSEEDVREYSKVMNTNMSSIYAMLLNVAKQVKGDKQIDHCLDLCSGPGRLTVFLHQQLHMKKTTGVDLSDRMIDIANSHAEEVNEQDNVTFCKSNIMDLKDFENDSFDLVTFADGAHHLDTIKDVRRVLEEAQRVCRPDGAIVLLDPIRQKTKSLTELYLKVSGKDYLDQGLNHFYEQFRDSMYAAWTTSELKESIPENSDNRWFHIVPNGLKLFQLVIGVPREQAELLTHAPISASEIKKIIPEKYHMDYMFLNLSFKGAKVIEISK
ncbi:class I SAM-dependent methyltransferase [Paraglaciecola aquimarina]|uniref:Class I SAM-dependent methyltransferase n=1 Tax=Paraglaciecola aquimarina TaxID=1235557 RepID=A0ABU3T200_9ALTE|nr:class I SAM-dependent methyltransferase [Paraglaciecola aquimarina]MDU0356276.1 class I SAM-dependent methyltransferase [Paraglaciecola aquimarina]